MSDITPSDIINWQNEILESETKTNKSHSQTYLKTIHNQLSALFNYAVKFYGLKGNPARTAGNMGKETRKELNFWTKDEYLTFSKAAMKKDGVYQAFGLLYWCGLRLGEMLALTPADFDFEKHTVRISKSLQRIHSEDVITYPKTEKGKRTVQMPEFLSEEIKDYISRLYDIQPNDRIFTMSKSGLHHEMDRCCKETGVKRIRIYNCQPLYVVYIPLTMDEIQVPHTWVIEYLSVPVALSYPLGLVSLMVFSCHSSLVYKLFLQALVYIPSS